MSLMGGMGKKKLVQSRDTVGFVYKFKEGHSKHFKQEVKFDYFFN